MRWLKHFTDASSDDRISELEEYHGLEGYAVYFKLLEMIGAALKKDNTCIRIPERKLKGILCISAQKLNKITRKLNDLQLVTIKKDGVFLEIDCPKMLEFRDNSTTKVRTKSAPKEEKVSLEVEVEVEVEPPNPQEGEKVKVASQLNLDTKKGRVAAGKMFLDEFTKPIKDGMSCWGKLCKLSVWNKKVGHCSQVWGCLRYSGISAKDIISYYVFLIGDSPQEKAHAFNYENCSVAEIQGWIDQQRHGEVIVPTPTKYTKEQMDEKMRLRKEKKDAAKRS